MTFFIKLSPDIESLPAWKWSASYPRCTMHFCLGENCVDYGACAIIDIHTDLSEEISKTNARKDHEIEMSNYVVGKLNLVSENMAYLTLYTNDDYQELVDVDEYHEELLRVFGRVDDFIRTKGEI